MYDITSWCLPVQNRPPGVDNPSTTSLVVLSSARTIGVCVLPAFVVSRPEEIVPASGNEIYSEKLQKDFHNESLITGRKVNF